MRNLWEDWPHLRGRFRNARRILFLLDFDGTLAHLVDHPRDARLEKRVRSLLGRLSRHPRAHVAILSGRALSDIRRRVGWRGISYGGNHGVERSGPGWKEDAEPRAGKGKITALAATLRRLAAETPGAWCEDKGIAIGIHFRQVSPGDLARLRRRLAPVRRRLPAGFRWTAGKKVWEIRPLEGGKGGAARRLWLDMKRPWVVAVGDDRTDEEMFRAMGGKGLTIRVGRPRHSRARYRLAGPDEVRRFLGEALLELSGRTP